MKRSFYFPLALSLFALSPNWAEELPQDLPPSVIEQHLERRSSALSPEQKLQLKQKRAAEKQAEEAQVFQNASLTSPAQGTQWQLAPAVSQVNFSYHIPDYTHWLASVGPQGLSLDMEDGTRWEVHPSDGYRLSSWRLNDPIVITPNYSWCSSGDFYITNQNTNTAVRADLVVSPISFGPYSHWIVNIDYNNGLIYLENGTSWSMSDGDFFVYRNWAINDHIIMGYNDSFFSPYDRILINFNMDSYVRAKQF